MWDFIVASLTAGSVEGRLIGSALSLLWIFPYIWMLRYLAGDSSEVFAVTIAIAFIIFATVAAWAFTMGFILIIILWLAVSILYDVSKTKYRERKKMLAELKNLSPIDCKEIL